MFRDGEKGKEEKRLKPVDLRDEKEKEKEQEEKPKPGPDYEKEKDEKPVARDWEPELGRCPTSTTETSTGVRLTGGFPPVGVRLPEQLTSASCTTTWPRLVPRTRKAWRSVVLLQTAKADVKRTSLLHSHLLSFRKQEPKS